MFHTEINYFTVDILLNEVIEMYNNVKRWDLQVQHHPSVVGFTDPKIWQERFETEYSSLKKGEFVIKIFTALLSDVRGFFIQNNYIDYP